MTRRVLALPLLLAASGLAAGCPAAAAGEGWPRYGMDDGGRRHSAAAQLTPGNVHRLRPAWTFRTGELGEGYASAAKLTFEATPILVGPNLVFPTGFNRVFAIDAVTGGLRWQADAGLDPAMRFSEVAARGVSFWPDGSAGGRIFLGTLDGRLLAFDAVTGEPCREFGKGGAVDLTADVRLRSRGQYQITSPPVIFEDLVVLGSAIGDNRGVELEFGVVRAYDARTGALRWAWDPIPRGGEATPGEWTPDGAERTGAANAWAPLSLDAERGLVFVPTGAPSPDFFGGVRPGDNRHANSLVALDVRTGRPVWARQLVHHDLWDYDLPAQPLLADLPAPDGPRPVVVQATKMGLLFAFDRRTGEPLFEVEERPVPASDVPGEQAAATQPFPSRPPPLVPHGPLRPEDAWGFTFLDRQACARRLRGLRSEGLYTPPSLAGTVMFPSYAGGSNWGGLAFDPARGLVFANVNNVAAVVRLVPRDAAAADLPGRTAQEGTPYVLSREILRSPLGAPCNPPPWGTLAAVDLAAGRIVWQVPLGTTRDMAPPPWLAMGVPNLGGPITTASGLVFIAAATDNYLRAFRAETGEELWRGRLPAGGQATPMTYMLEGRQFVVVAAGGHGPLGTTRGDRLVAFALGD